MHYTDGHFWGMHFFWWIFWIVILIWVFILPYGIPPGKRKKEKPLEILKNRYAKGEISKKEYEEAKRTLKSKS
ncbi:SHOCT domain-containing protein [Christiangramia crocea]|uniref:SHOCT domain-containing protein n=1 Tax=Christiangramia crocea TaxID=2904124 RepID=A0A9X1UWT9_9FLAO|nr:SHOCT domain-containing protein [Gramella crocea]MCG9971825.1 SHOCT domain-containing protein [Gramella crocea]